MVNLGICFILLLILFGLSTSLSDYAFSYFVVVSFRGCIAFIMWYINRRRLLKKYLMYDFVFIVLVYKNTLDLEEFFYH